MALTAVVTVLPGLVETQDFCPSRCSDAGPDTDKWSVYPNFNLIKRCKETVFYRFNLYDSVEDRDSSHRIAACTSFGSDFGNMEATPATAGISSRAEVAGPTQVKFELGWFEEGFGLAVAGITALVKQMREYVDKGYADTTDRPFILYGRAGQASIGVYIGQGLLRQGLGESALRIFEDNFNKLNVTSPSLAMQLCDDKSISTHIFGVVVTSNATFASIQNAIRSWADTKCLSFSGSRDFAGTVTYTTPVIDGRLANSTTGNNFTGDRLTSYATPGRCTETGGYIADAEMNEIIRGNTNGKRQNSRVTTHFLDTSSNSDMPVYDNNQWVGHMSESTKAIRTKLHASLGMAGTTDWASDLQKFHDPTKPAKDWSSSISLARAGGDPKVSTVKLGKWREGSCESEYVKYPYNYDPDVRWKELDAASAWNEIIVKWTGTDKNRLTFMQSVEQTLLAGSNMGCEVLGGTGDNCDARWECPAGANGPDSGPAAYVIWQSLIQVHRMFHDYYNGLSSMRGGVQTTIRRMENVFAPIPEPKTNQWLNVMIDFLTIGALGGAAPFFNSVLKTLPAFAKEGSALFDNSKDTALNMIGQGTTLAKDLLQAPSEDKWTPQEQKDFSDYAAQAVFGWMNSTTLSLKKLFDGEGASLDALSSIIKDGRMLPGAGANMGSSKGPIDIEATARKTFFAYAIPGLWRRSKQYAFILDSGEGCSGNPASKYVDDDTAKATSVCVNDKMYYLVAPEGDANECKCERVTDMGPCQTICRDQKFSAPKGIGSLTDDEFGKLTRDDIVKGALATYGYNGRENKIINLTEIADEKNVREKLLGLDSTTPGLIQLPVCSPSRAWQAWSTGTKGGSDHYPCDILPRQGSLRRLVV